MRFRLLVILSVFAHFVAAQVVSAQTPSLSERSYGMNCPVCPPPNCPTCPDCPVCELCPDCPEPEPCPDCPDPEPCPDCPEPEPCPDCPVCPTPPTPPPTPTPQACKYFKGEIVSLGFSETTLESYDKIFQKSGEAQGLNCLDKMIERAIATCESALVTSTRNPLRHHDDCLAWEFASYTMPDWGNNKTQKLGTHSNGSVCTSLHIADMGWCPSGSQWGFGIARGCKPCGTGHFYFDSDPNNPDMCRIVTPDPDTELCGDFSLNYWRSTPISLEWEPEDKKASYSFSRFPLDLRNKELWHVWKGSAARPLLVYDPSHSGKIRSADQLFGNWTFGGQPHAALNGSSVATPWENGYQALATLDLDGNGLIDGKELETLGLWFDHNRNGIAEQGEVVALTASGVSELTYGPTKTDSDGDIYVENGYRRVVDGKLQTGRTVDWSTISAPTQADLLSAYFAAGKGGAVEDPAAKSLQDKKGDDTEQDKLAAATSLDDYLGGAWRWAAIGDESEGARGHFILKDDGADGVSGYTLLETPFRNANSDKLRSYATMFALNGVKSRDITGRLVLNFKTVNDKSETESRAVLSDDLKVMEGLSTVKGSGQRSVTYRWVARRR